MKTLKRILSAMAVALIALPAFAATAAPKVDSGNTAWLLVSAALVLLMTPGLAFFYAGMVARKNVVSTLLQNYVAMAIVGVAWVVIGYSLVFTTGGPYLGGTTLQFLNGVHGTFYGETGIPNMAFMVFQMMFAIITPALITGAFAERVNFKAWILIMLLWSLCIYVPVAHWVWGPDGWLFAKGALDFAGGLVVHITAGFSGLACALVFGKRTTNPSRKPNDVPMVMLGAALLWFGWFGFNAGSALTAGELASYAFVNTFLGAAAAFLAWMAIEWVVDGRPTAIGSSIGIVVGLVAITPAAGFVDIKAAMIIGVAGGAAAFFISKQVKKITHLDDALDVFACHGIGGVVGAILTGVYANKLVNPSIAIEGLAIGGDHTVFNANLVGVVAVAAFSFVGTWIIVKVVSIFMPVHVGADIQGVGLDTHFHGESARTHDRTK
jgi:Amt family ammonium transporter